MNNIDRFIIAISIKKRGSATGMELTISELEELREQLDRISPQRCKIVKARKKNVK